MFDRIQYIFEIPKLDRQLVSKGAIKDLSGNILGFFARKLMRSWLEDKDGNKLCEEYELRIVDGKGQPLGRIIISGRSSSLNKYTIGSCKVYGLGDRLMAYVDKFSYKASFLGSDASARVASLRKNGLDIMGPDGSALATVHSTDASDGCQVDLYSPNVDQLLVLNLISDLITGE